MQINVAVVNAFVDGAADTGAAMNGAALENTIGGNPAGVVLDADSLTSIQKREIARKVGLSETAFVSKSSVADFKLEFFTPTRQIAHCGHATIATFSYLAEQGLVPAANTSKETIDGCRSIRMQNGFAYMEQLKPKYIDVTEDETAILKSLRLAGGSVTVAPIIANTGNSFVLVGVRDLETLKRIQPDQILIEELSEKWDLIGFYVFAQETCHAGRDASARMFAPRYGIQEESATGMAAGPLASFLHDHLGIHKRAFEIEQGYCMPNPSPSCIHVTLEKSGTQITSLSAGGRGVLSRMLQIEIDATL